MGIDLRRRIRAGLIAGALSGLPSTVWALARHNDPLEAAVAAGRLLRPYEADRMRLALSAGAAHAALSLGWAVVIGGVLPRYRSRAAAVGIGAACGAGIAAVDLGGAWLSSGPRMAGVKSLAVLPQIADHLAYGAIVAAVIARQRA